MDFDDSKIINIITPADGLGSFPLDGGGHIRMHIIIRFA